MPLAARNGGCGRDLSPAALDAGGCLAVPQGCPQTGSRRHRRACAGRLAGCSSGAPAGQAQPGCAATLAAGQGCLAGPRPGGAVSARDDGTRGGPGRGRGQCRRNSPQGSRQGPAADKALDTSMLGDVFGIEMDVSAAPTNDAGPQEKPVAAKAIAKKTAKGATGITTGTSKKPPAIRQAATVKKPVSATSPVKRSARKSTLIAPVAPAYCQMRRSAARKMPVNTTADLCSPPLRQPSSCCWWHWSVWSVWPSSCRRRSRAGLQQFRRRCR